MLSRAWNIIVKRLRRLHVSKTLEYLAVVEGTKRGEPHLHILYRGPWVDQRTLSRWMTQLTGAPIVDVRAVKGRREVVRYVAKYITKKPEQFGTSKRYWRSTQYSEPQDSEYLSVIPSNIPWLVVHAPIEMLRAEYKDRGFRVWNMEPEYMYAERSP